MSWLKTHVVDGIRGKWVRLVETVGTHPRAVGLLADMLRAEGLRLGARDPGALPDAVELLERSWRLRPLPETAVRLGEMYGALRRHEEVLDLFRTAYRRHPDDPQLRLAAAMSLLRHGDAGDVGEFFAGVERRDPADPFVAFRRELQETGVAWLDALSGSLGGPGDGPEPYVIACPVWRPSAAADFDEGLCATWLAPGNLPALAARHPVHVAVCTTPDIERRLRDRPNVGRIAGHASLHFLTGSEALADPTSRMVAAHGEELGGRYARACEALLASSVQHLCLDVAHRAAGVAMPARADWLLADGSFTRIAELMSGDIDAVLVLAVPLAGAAREAIGREVRQADGTIRLAAADVARLCLRFAMEVGSLWRVGEEGVLVHSSELQPCAIHARAIAPRIHLDILERIEPDKLHRAHDARAAIVRVERSPAAAAADAGVLSEIGRRNMQTPVKLAIDPTGPHWTAAEREARAVVDRRLDLSNTLERRAGRYASWRLSRD